MIDVLVPAAVWLLLSVGAVQWSRTRRSSGAEWPIADALLALLVMLWSSSLGAALFLRISAGTWTPTPEESTLIPAVLGTGAGGLLTVVFLRARADWRALGLVPTELKWQLKAVLWSGAFLGVSMLWGGLLQYLGVEPQQDISLAVMERWPSTEAAVLIGYGVLIAPLVEELLFRGFLLPPLVRRLGAAGGVGISAVLFGLMHLSDPQAVPPLIVLGAVLGWLRLRSGSLWPALLLHVCNNSVAFLLLLASLRLEGVEGL